MSLPICKVVNKRQTYILEKKIQNSLATMMAKVMSPFSLFATQSRLWNTFLLIPAHQTLSSSTILEVLYGLISTTPTSMLSIVMNLALVVFFVFPYLIFQKCLEGSHCKKK
ncbi:hypothetical protein J3Q64DRAFT_1183316 [Phycomyces blakesleeanus]|uniref:ABC transmembrane type-1 domain-containing protein n=1 Tax=Phycomyces blakesleeanus TaxID=4837 RepID=A0ABR3AU29_PHYBL